MPQQKIIFLFGGPGAEHDVSVSTAKSALPAFDTHFLIKPVFITKDKTWVVADSYVPVQEAWGTAESLLSHKGINQEIALETIANEDPSLIFIGLHGEFGEDGTLQTLLEAKGLAFTGSDAEASALAMDKPKVFELLQNEGLMVPEFLEITPDLADQEIEDFATFHCLPIVVLPCDSGSSVDVKIIRKISDLVPAVKALQAKHKRPLVTKYIAGREFSVATLVTSPTDLISLSPTELIPQNGREFFDYDAKYKPDECKEITPADVSPEVTTRMQALAKRVHQLVGADGYSRTDMILDNKGIIYILEINTLPGMTATSILPQQAQEYGLSFTQLLNTICNNVDRSGKDYVTAVE